MLLKKQIMKLKTCIHSSIAVITIVCFFAACNLAPEKIPFPDADNEYRLDKDSLILSPAVKVIFDSSKHKLIRPSIKKFDFNHLPTKPFDTNGFNE